MNRQELVKQRRLRPEVPQKMAAGALNLCMGCPLANICPTKTPGECPPQLAEQVVEYSGDGDYAPIKTSYMSELLDDSKPTVMANLIKKPVPPPKRTPKAALPIHPPVLPAPHSTPPKSPKQPPKPRPNRSPAYPHEQLGEAIADIFYAMLSVRSLKSTTSKQSR